MAGSWPEAFLFFLTVICRNCTPLWTNVELWAEIADLDSHVYSRMFESKNCTFVCCVCDQNLFRILAQSLSFLMLVIFEIGGTNIWEGFLMSYCRRSLDMISDNCRKPTLQCIINEVSRVRGKCVRVCFCLLVYLNVGEQAWLNVNCPSWSGHGTDVLQVGSMSFTQSV